MDMLAELLSQRRSAGRMGRAEAVACIADRLHALGRPPDLLTADAVEALIAYAGGSLARLRAALTSTLFLAATDEQAQIGPETVERAVQELAPAKAEAALPGEFPVPPEPEEGGFPRASYRGGLGNFFLAGGATLAAAALLILGWAVLAGPPPEPIAKAPVAAQTASAQPDNPLSGTAGPSHASVPAQPPPALGDGPTPALPAPLAVSNPPLPPTAQPLGGAQTAGGAQAVGGAQPAAQPAPPAEAKPVLPVAPLAAVVLRFRPHDPEAMFKLGVATQQLRAAGYTRIYSWPLRKAEKPGGGIRYFFAEDSQTARAVQAALSDLEPATGPDHGTQLVEQRRTRAPHPPGTVEVLIP